MREPGTITRVPITPADWVARLSEVSNESAELITEHLATYGELLLHPLMADTRRLALAAFVKEDDAMLDRILAVVEVGLTDGEEAVQNAVAVSFVEDTGWWEIDMYGFISCWPAGLRAEAERQGSWRA